LRGASKDRTRFRDYHRFARGVPLRSICALFFRLRSPKTAFIVIRCSAIC
jgi:hypothetical protein